MRQKLLDTLLEETFYKSWRGEISNNNYWPSIEFIVNGKCDQHCKYCYIANYGDKLFPEGSQNDQMILDNTSMIMRWLKKNSFRPRIDLFSAEIFSQEIGFQVLELISDLGWEGMAVGIPSNFNFLFRGDDTQRVLDINDKAIKRGQSLLLSSSVDGKFMEDNRPLASGKLRDDAFYDKLFSIWKILHHGFHPMVYSEGIERWKDNFLWYQSNFDKYGIPYHNLYLLEVRNKEWTKDQSLQLGFFVEFLVKWLVEKTKSDDEFLRSIFSNGAFNLLSSPCLYNSRGMTCSVQTTEMVRLGDLSIWPCHRTMYPALKLAQMEVVDEEIVRIKEVNYPLYLATKYGDRLNFPYCVACDIKELCTGGCYGSQFEITGDLFTPIPTMCMMEHAKVFSLLKALKYSTNIWSNLKLKVVDKKRIAIQNLEVRGLI
jgi:radical SAM protein with 4Fe4S-binding SPASM domain